MKRSETINELASALSKAQGQIEDATKTGLNPAFRSKYADLAAVRAVIREPLFVNDLAIMQFPRAASNGGVEVETMLVHKTGEFVSETLQIPLAKQDAHGYGSAITYARRYGLMGILALAAEDDDGNEASGKGGAAPAPAKPDPKKAAPIIEEGITIAGTGSEALREWYKALPKAKRELLSQENIADLKKIADAVEAKKESSNG
jgi:hypothetical protein